MILIDIDAPQSNQNNFCYKKFSFHEIFIYFCYLLELFRIISIVFDLKYVGQNSNNFNMLGVFWNPQDKQISKLSLAFYFEPHLNYTLRFFTAAVAGGHHCINVVYSPSMNCL